MTRLLVSVRNREEAEAALAGGADLIDIKEPANGPLGQATVEIQQSILTAVAGRAPLSAAMGELRSEPPTPPSGFAFAKWGFANAGNGWRDRWRRARDMLPGGCQAVAVAYADGHQVDAPSVLDILDFAIPERAGAFLIDTAIKDGCGLLQHISIGQLREIVAESSRYELPVALAGSLDLTAIAQLVLLRPGWIAVRGAACSGGRAGVVREDRVRQLVRVVNGSPV